MPKVSIIIPSYNHARFLEQRLDSILNQTYQDFEIIFLDDASSDNTKEVFAKYAHHPKVTKVIFNSQNSGSPFKQWNKGVKQAKGEYIWIAESDDYAEVTFLETMVPLLDKNLKVGIVYCQSLQVNEKGKVIRSYQKWTDKLDKQRWKTDFTNQGIKEVQNYLIWQNTIPNASGVLMRKSAYLKSGMAPENMKMLGDWKTYLSILSQYEISFVSSILNYNRFHSQVSRLHKTANKKIHRYIEGYSILDFIFSNFEIDEITKSEVCFALLKSWLNKLSLSDMFRPNSIPLIRLYLKIDKRGIQHFFYILINLIKNDLEHLSQKMWKSNVLKSKQKLV
ncbi:MAG: glycosyltransferase [Crocosphaera sp.]